DRFMPRQFSNRGDRLVFSNGIVILAIFSSILVAAFGGDTSRLIPLYAVGVFLSFTLSQLGMVRHWLKERDRNQSVRETGRASEGQSVSRASDKARGALPDPELTVEEAHKSTFVTDEVTAPSNWKKSIVINGVGAIATALVMVVLIVTKFVHG